MTQAATAASTEHSTKSKAPRLRSPGYPGIDLEAAIKRALEFYDHERRNAAHAEIAVQHWGFKPSSGGGFVVIAALKAYGLISDTGSGKARKIQLTDLALRILLDKRPDSPDREASIKQAALMPKIHASLWNKYRGDIPSDSNLRHELIFERKFNENAVDDFIKQYRATIDFAKLNDSDSISLSAEDIEDNGMLEGEQSMQNQQVTPATQGNQSVPRTIPAGKPVGASIPVTKNCSVSILATGEVTQKGLEQLISYINLIKGSFPEDESGAAN
jgi:hypothetical protein